MLVSVGIPTYNRPCELERALKSVLGQSHEDLEVILSNNGSTDSRVGEIISHYASVDPRIRAYEQDPGLRVIKNFQFVLDEAKGEYFLWLADDDWLDKEYVATCVERLRADRALSLVCGRCVYHGEDGMVLDSNSSISIDSDISLHRVLKYYRTVKLNGYYYGVMKTALAKQIRLQEQLGFDCLFIASVMFTGKVKVVDSVASHKTIGGMSHDSDALVSNMGNRRFFTKYLVGLTVAANAARDVFQSPVYGMKGWRRFVHPVRIGLAAYSNTFRWDVALNARRVSRRLARLIEGQSS